MKTTSYVHPVDVANFDTGFRWSRQPMDDREELRLAYRSRGNRAFQNRCIAHLITAADCAQRNEDGRLSPDEFSEWLDENWTLPQGRDLALRILTLATISGQGPSAPHTPTDDSLVGAMVDLRIFTLKMIDEGVLV